MGKALEEELDGDDFYKTTYGGFEEVISLVSSYFFTISGKLIFG